MQLSKAHQLFQLAMLGEKADSTRGWYKQRIGRLIQFLGDCHIEEVTIYRLREWRASLFEQETRWGSHPTRPAQNGGLSIKTIHGYIRACRRFFTWLVEEGLLGESPADRLRPPKIPDQGPMAIDLADVRRLIEACSCPRDLALLLFLIDTGARCAGAVGLRWSDLDLPRRRATVREKGDKLRTVYLSRVTVEVLREWKGTQIETAPDEPRVFLVQTGDGIRQILYRLAARAGVEGPHNPHSFRHAFALESLLNGADLATVSQLLGHSSIQVTGQFYARFADEQLAGQHHRYSPARNLTEAHKP